MNKLNKINKAYSKRLHKLNKSFFQDNTVGLVLFAEYLKYLRDKMLIKAATDGGKAVSDSNVLGALVIATGEFDAYQNSEETKQKEFHWNNFCDFIKLNMEEWLVLSDSI